MPTVDPDPLFDAIERRLALLGPLDPVGQDVIDAIVLRNRAMISAFMQGVSCELGVKV